MLLIAVACFNIVSTLFMAVNEKQAAIAVLKTMGADDHLILKIFMLHGMINGCLGALVGTALGTILAVTISDVVLYFEQLSGKQLIAGDVYFIDFLHKSSFLIFLIYKRIARSSPGADILLLISFIKFRS